MSVTDIIVTHMRTLETSPSGVAYPTLLPPTGSLDLTEPEKASIQLPLLLKTTEV